MLERRFFNAQLINLMLGKETDAEFGGRVFIPLHQGQTIREQFRQGRFAFAVASQERDTVVLIDA